MKLKFYKQGDNNCVEILTKDGKAMDFDYIKMVEQIFIDQEIEDADIDEKYSEEERLSIKSLMLELSETISPLFKDKDSREDIDINDIFE